MRDLESSEKAALLCKAVRNSQLFDKELGMYRVNESLEKLPLEIGRLRTFTPGWLENESIFLHMEYKYLIEVLRKGLYEEFFRDVRKALVPFMVPETYGRSIFENSSFIASSANPDKSVHGNGFVARLSGSTSEFYNMLLLMTLGEKPFVLNGGQLELAIVPALPGWIFTAKREKVKIFTDGVEEVILIESGSFIFRCLGGTLFIFRNPSGKDVFGSARISKMVLSGHGAPAEIRGNIIPSPYSKMVRDGKIRRIDVHVC